MIFVDTPNEKLFCSLCDSVFTDPVIVRCGVCNLCMKMLVNSSFFYILNIFFYVFQHTFCRACVKCRDGGI